MTNNQLQCYNKGCGKKFTTEENIGDCCRYHPGAPIFHDARKGWSCCNKFSTDFSDFLNTPGCKKGLHSNEKPKEPEVPKLDAKYDTEVVEVKPVKPPETVKLPRPSSDEPLIPIPVTVAPTLTKLLESKQKDIGKSTKAEQNGDDVPEGTECKNNGCKTKYYGSESNKQLCLHHPGFPIFHEGMKYWTCCQRKTSDFDNFMAQEGCSTGKHLWFKQKVPSNASCRYDWHQTGPNMTVSFYAKSTLPDTTRIEANQVTLSVNIDFDLGQSSFCKTFKLFGIIDPKESKVKISPTKVEIIMRKAEAISWRTMDLPDDTINGDN